MSVNKGGTPKELEESEQEATKVAYGRGYISYQNTMKVLRCEMSLADALRKGNPGVPGGVPPIEKSPIRRGRPIPEDE